jgi:ABC-2 type transport system ATP-binding protein
MNSNVAVAAAPRLAPPAPAPARAETRKGILSAQGLHFAYPKAKTSAVAGVSLEVHPGEILGLLGPNGAGKTTTTRILAGKLLPTQGGVSICGIDTRHSPAMARRHIGLVSQSTSLDLSLSVRENLTYHGAYHGLTRKVREQLADELLDQWGLREKSGARIATLSGGMVRRLMIARALVHQPALLLLDEPTAGLDPQSRLFLWERLAELRREKKAILLATHDMNEAERMCDRVAIIDHGTVLACAAPAELTGAHPGSRSIHLEVEHRDASAMSPAQFSSYLVELLVAIRGVERVEPVGAAGLADGEGDATRLNFRMMVDGDRVLPVVIEAVREARAELLNVTFSKPSLEDVFIAQTGRALRC